MVVVVRCYYLAPQEKERGIKYRPSLSQYSLRGFMVAIIGEDPTTGPGRRCWRGCHGTGRRFWHDGDRALSAQEIPTRNSIILGDITHVWLSCVALYVIYI